MCVVTVSVAKYYKEDYSKWKHELYWWKWEYHDTKGNLPHIHCLLWTNDSKHKAVDVEKLKDLIISSF
jgi:hypothetical protein